MKTLKKMFLATKDEYVFYEKRSKIKSLLRPFMSFLVAFGIIILFKTVDNSVISNILSILLFCMLLGIDFFYLEPKILIIGCKNIRFPLHWKFDWSEVEKCTMNKEERILLIKNNGKDYSFPFIKGDDVERLHDVIELCLKNRKDVMANIVG